jgi:carbonic anhydrase
VLVLGHERCGAVQAAHDLLTKGEPLPGHIAALVVPIVPAVQAARTIAPPTVGTRSSARGR